MYSLTDLGAGLIGDFRLKDMMRYSLFVPRLYNLCTSLGFEKGRIMPSRAFCSDENQGFPIILLAKHFGAFPFNHGKVGGVVATDRHAPHASHGKDMLIIQASHVGYDPESERLGIYRRIQTGGHSMSADCGKLCSVNDWYESEYQLATENILLSRRGEEHLITIDNLLLHDTGREGLFLYLHKLLKAIEGKFPPQATFSTSKSFIASDTLVSQLPPEAWGTGRGRAIGRHLSAELFFYRRAIEDTVEGQRHLEANLQEVMPLIVTADSPALTAAMINTQIEFDRTFRTLLREPAYQGKRLLFISGLNIDISPNEGQIFPLTKFVPWAAYLQHPNGSHEVWEQRELTERIMAQSTDNPDQIDLEAAIAAMVHANEVTIRL